MTKQDEGLKLLDNVSRLRATGQDSLALKQLFEMFSSFGNYSRFVYGLATIELSSFALDDDSVLSVIQDIGRRAERELRSGSNANVAVSVLRVLSKMCGYELSTSIVEIIQSDARHVQLLVPFAMGPEELASADLLRRVVSSLIDREKRIVNALERAPEDLRYYSCVRELQLIAEIESLCASSSDYELQEAFNSIRGTIRTLLE